MKTPSTPNKIPIIELNTGNQSAQSPVCDGMTFRLHDDSFPFVRLFGIDRKQADYQRPQDPHRDHGLVLLNPQNDLPARVAVLT